MTFNHRRVSQDKLLRQYILDISVRSGYNLWMNAYTRKLFKDLTEQEESCISVDEDYLGKASPGDFCYVENCAVKPYEQKVEKIFYCLWNRAYPADTYWDIDMSRWVLASSEDIIGSSHEKITINSYIRE